MSTHFILFYFSFCFWHYLQLQCFILCWQSGTLSSTCAAAETCSSGGCGHAPPGRVKHEPSDSVSMSLFSFLHTVTTHLCSLSVFSETKNIQKCVFFCIKSAPVIMRLVCSVDFYTGISKQISSTLQQWEKQGYWLAGRERGGDQTRLSDVSASALAAGQRRGGGCLAVCSPTPAVVCSQTWLWLSGCWDTPHHSYTQLELGTNYLRNLFLGQNELLVGF